MNARSRDNPEVDILFHGRFVRLPVEALLFIATAEHELRKATMSLTWRGWYGLAVVVFSPKTRRSYVFSNPAFAELLDHFEDNPQRAAAYLRQWMAATVGIEDRSPTTRSVVQSSFEPTHLWIESDALPSMRSAFWEPQWRRERHPHVRDLPLFVPPSDEIPKQSDGWRTFLDFLRAKEDIRPGGYLWTTPHTWRFDSLDGRSVKGRFGAGLPMNALPSAWTWSWTPQTFLGRLRSHRESTAIIRRTPHIDVRTDVPFKVPQLGERFEVTVYADEQAAQPGEETKDITLEGAEGQDEYEVRAWLTCSKHFKVVDTSPLRSLVIKRGRPRSEDLVFHLMVCAPLDEAQAAAIAVHFDYNARPCGYVRRTIGVPADAASKSGGRPAMVVDPRARPADLTIQITDPDNTLQAFQCVVTTPLLKKYRKGLTSPWRLNEKTKELVLTYFEKFTQAPNNARRLAALRGAGKNLFKASPRIFKNAFWEIIDAKKPLRTISVVSQEPWIPWELMVPLRTKGGRREQRQKPLGTEFVVGRWSRDDNVSPPQSVKLVNSRIFAPKYPVPKDPIGSRPKPLASAAAEADLVALTFPGTPIAPAVFEALQAALKAGGATILHFVCHGADSKGLIQNIYLEDQSTLSSVELEGMDELAECCATAKPLVFLNACEVGRTIPALVGIGGFASVFIEAGASCVIAPLWSVKDSIAHEVAKAFYGALRSDVTLPFAEIVRSIRAKAYVEGGGEDTYAAYCFYGDPLAARIASDATGSTLQTGAK